MQFAFKAVYLPANEIVSPDIVYSAEENYRILLMSESIKQNGLLFPVYLKLEKSPPYKIICGRKRYRAAVLSGMAKIPCILCKVSESKALLMRAVSNKNETEAVVKKLIDKGLSEEYLSTALCKSSSQIEFKAPDKENKNNEISVESIISLCEKPRFSGLKINDGRFLVNTIRKAVDAMADGEFPPKFTQKETDSFTEIKIRIPKWTSEIRR